MASPELDCPPLLDIGVSVRSTASCRRTGVIGLGVSFLACWGCGLLVGSNTYSCAPFVTGSIVVGAAFLACRRVGATGSAWVISSVGSEAACVILSTAAILFAG